VKFIRLLALVHCLAFLTGNIHLAFADDSSRISTLEKEIEKLKESYKQLVKPRVRPDHDFPKLQLRGFAHLQYDYDSRKTLNSSGAVTSENDSNNFATGNVDLYVTSQVSKNLSFLMETLFESRSEGENVLDVERVLLRYEYKDWLNISIGRGHTALGYWNQRFHHGTWLHTTTDRPLVYKFEDDGGILPVHFVGLEFSGNISFDFGDLSYTANVANGRGKSATTVQLIEDANDDKQLSFMFTLAPKALKGIEFGGNFLFDKIPKDGATAGRGSEIEEIIFGGHLFYIDERVELIGEYQYIRHDLDIRSKKNHSGGYVQFGYTFGDKIKPYYRFDFLRIQSGDPFFTGLAGVENSDQHTVGLRYDWLPFAAIKLEYRNLNADTTKSEAGTVQISFAF